MATKRLNIQPLSPESKDRIARMREADARGENASRIAVEGFSMAEVASSLRRLA